MFLGWISGLSTQSAFATDVISVIAVVVVSSVFCIMFMFTLISGIPLNKLLRNCDSDCCNEVGSGSG